MNTYYVMCYNRVLTIAENTKYMVNLDKDG